MLWLQDWHKWLICFVFLSVDMKVLKVYIEFSLDQPKGGLHFVVPDVEGSMAERGAHVFSFGFQNSTRCKWSSSDIWVFSLSMSFAQRWMSWPGFGSPVWTPTPSSVRGNWSSLWMPPWWRFPAATWWRRFIPMTWGKRPSITCSPSRQQRQTSRWLWGPLRSWWTPTCMRWGQVCLYCNFTSLLQAKISRA